MTKKIQAFLDFQVFDYCDFGFMVVYISILFYSPLLLSNLHLHGFCFGGVFFGVPTPTLTA